MKPAHCTLCGSVPPPPSSFVGAAGKGRPDAGHHARRWLRLHEPKCEAATVAARGFYLRFGHWPRTEKDGEVFSVRSNGWTLPVSEAERLYEERRPK